MNRQDAKGATGRQGVRDPQRGPRMCVQASGAVPFREIILSLGVLGALAVHIFPEVLW
jgi:hypothetical protein